MRQIGMLVIISLMASVAGCKKDADGWKKPVQDAVLKPAADADAGAATPEELVQLYQQVHQRKDVERYRRTLDSHMATLRDWVPTNDRVKQELGTLFSFELETARLEKQPGGGPGRSESIWYLFRGKQGKPHCSCSVIGLPAIGKLVLEGRWPGGERIELDPGLAIVVADSTGGPRCFVSYDVNIFTGGLLAKAKAERSDCADHFRPIPLGVPSEAALQVAGKAGQGGKTWEETLRDLERLRQQAARGGELAPRDHTARHGASSIDDLVRQYAAAHRAKDPRPLRDRLEWTLCKLPPWTETPRKQEEAIRRLFALELRSIRVQRLPDQARWIMYLGPRGARFLKILRSPVRSRLCPLGSARKTRGYDGLVKSTFA